MDIGPLGDLSDRERFEPALVEDIHGRLQHRRMHPARSDRPSGEPSQDRCRWPYREAIAGLPALAAGQVCKASRLALGGPTVVKSSTVAAPQRPLGAQENDLEPRAPVDHPPPDRMVCHGRLDLR